jgi:predicted nucleic acid-binding protein
LYFSGVCPRFRFSPPRRASAREAGLLDVRPVADYEALAAIIARYADLPCDYADATLIALAETTDVSAIATVDQRDFSLYRLRGRKRFRILLQARFS